MITERDRKALLRFVVLMDMHIYPKDQNTITSFILGYEIGTNSKCDLTLRIRKLLEQKYRITYSNMGWPGQIERLAEKRSLSWPITFRRIALEIIAEKEVGGRDKLTKNIVGGRAEGLIERIRDRVGEQYFWGGDWWVEDWVSLCVIKKNGSSIFGQKTSCGSSGPSISR